jgi:glucose/arabinose dehydrogenase
MITKTNHRSFIHFPVLISLFILIGGCNITGNGQIKDKENGGLILPEGFTAVVAANNLGSARHIVVNQNGDIYISLQRKTNNGGIVALRDKNNDGIADEIKYFGTFTGTGIGIYNGYLYFGSDTAVVRYKLITGALLPDPNYEIIAHGFIPTRQHESKPFTFDDNGNIYITVGAPSNACQEPDRQPGVPGQDPCPLLERFGGIWRFKAEVKNQFQVTDGYRYATGIRNAVALNWNHKINQLYALQHGRDQLSQFWPELYSEDEGVNLPSEEFFEVKEKSDFGWPYCYYDHYQNKKLLMPEYGGDKKKTERCADKDQPIMAFPAHMAPNDLVFYTKELFPQKYNNGAFIAFHGSWNRAPQPQKGFFVAFVPFNGEKPSGDWEIFADGFAGEGTIASPSDAKHRPCGLSVAPDGSLYVVDSRVGKVWKINYQSK